MSATGDQSKLDVVEVTNLRGRSSAVVICEHASAFIPPEFDHLGLPAALRESHVVWDPGALGVARRMSGRLDAVLVAGAISRLIYDCNRPPDAVDAMPARSEVIDIPGNAALDDRARADRIARVYAPFKTALSNTIGRLKDPVIVTVHSFTPVYRGKPRSVELGILHDTDARLADAMLATAERHTSLDVMRNAPYGPEDGVTHTLREHAVRAGHLNVMIEIRNDLIRTPAAQAAMGDLLAAWTADAFAGLGAPGDIACTV